MLPFAPAVADIVGMNVAAIVWAAWTLVKVQPVIIPMEPPSTVTFPMAYPDAGAIAKVLLVPCTTAVVPGVMLPCAPGVTVMVKDGFWAKLADIV